MDSWLAYILGPLSAIIIVLFQNWRSGRNNRENVEVAAEEAETHRFEVLLLGYDKRVMDLDTALNATKAELVKAQETLAAQVKVGAALAERVEQLAADVKELDADRAALLGYVAVIEAMLPEPPNVKRPEMRRR